MPEAEWRNRLRARPGRTEVALVVVALAAIATIATILPAAGSRIAGASVRLQSMPGNPAAEPPGASPIGPAPAGASLPLVVGPTPLSVAVSGTQTYGGAASFGGSDSPPAGVSVDTTGLSCATVGDSTPISATLSAGSYTLKPASCSGVTLSGANAADYSVAYTSAADDFTVDPAPLSVAVSGTQTYGGTVPTITPSYSGFENGDTAASLTTAPMCSTIAASTSPVSGSPYVTSCGGAVDANYAITYTGGFVTVSQAPLTVTASSGAITYGGTVPTITPSYSGFENGDTASILTTAPTCSTIATSTSPVSASPYTSSCGGGADSNYSFAYVNGGITVSQASLSVGF